LARPRPGAVPLPISDLLEFFGGRACSSNPWETVRLGVLKRHATMSTHNDLVPTCPICLEPNWEPRLIHDCSHGLCQPCANHLLNEGRGMGKCPICRKYFSPTGVGKNFDLVQILIDLETTGLIKRPKPEEAQQPMATPKKSPSSGTGALVGISVHVSGSQVPYAKMDFSGVRGRAAVAEESQGHAGGGARPACACARAAERWGRRRYSAGADEARDPETGLLHSAYCAPPWKPSSGPRCSDQPAGQWAEHLRAGVGGRGQRSDHAGAGDARQLGQLPGRAAAADAADRQRERSAFIQLFTERLVLGRRVQQW
jgi:hypothetical protein